MLSLVLWRYWRHWIQIWGIYWHSVRQFIEDCLQKENLWRFWAKI